MKREQLLFLVGGFAFGILVGFALFHALDNPPGLPSGEAPTGAMGGGPTAGMSGGSDAGVGGAPMVKRINQLRRDLDQDPGNMAAAVDLADIYQRAGMWEQAAGFYEQALEIEAEHPQLLVNLGLCYRGAGRYEDALESFEQANRLDPQNWQSLFNKVVVAALDLQRFEVALGTMTVLEEMPSAPGGPDEEQLGQLREWLVAARSAAEEEG